MKRLFLVVLFLLIQAAAPAGYAQKQEAKFPQELQTAMDTVDKNYLAVQADQAAAHKLVLDLANEVKKPLEEMRVDTMDTLVRQYQGQALISKLSELYTNLDEATRLEDSLISKPARQFNPTLRHSPQEVSRYIDLNSLDRHFSEWYLSSLKRLTGQIVEIRDDAARVDKASQILATVAAIVVSKRGKAEGDKFLKDLSACKKDRLDCYKDLIPGWPPAKMPQ